MNEEKIIICPKCSSKSPETAAECSNCGIVFEKYKKSKMLSLDKATSEYKAKNFIEARQLFFKHVEQYPEDKKVQKYIEEATFKAAVAAFQENQLEDAQELFMELQKDFPHRADDAESYCKEINNRLGADQLQKAIEAYNNKNTQHALSLFTKVTEMYPEHQAEATGYIEKINNEREERKVIIDFDEVFAIRALELISILNLIAGIICAMIFPFAFEFSIMGIFLAFVSFCGGVFGSVFMSVICSIAASLIEIRQNTATAE